MHHTSADADATRLDAICALIAGDPIHAADRRRIIEAIELDGRAHGGEVHPSRVRAALSDDHGLVVYPRVLAAMYRVLYQRGFLRWSHWEMCDDFKGRNAGKMSRVYRLTAWV